MSTARDVSPQGQPSSADTGSSAGQDELAVRLGEVARDLQQQPHPRAVLQAVVRWAIALVPGVDEGSISVVLGRKKVDSQAASGELARVVDALQEEVGQGPCLDAVYEQQTVRVIDMTAEQRWPDFSRRASEAGAASMLSLQLYVEGDNLGALNLYARRAGAFTDESEHVGLLFATHAGVAYAGAQQESGLNKALASRQLIGQAQGILMERRRLSADQAFTELVRVSQERNVKLHAVAERLVSTGELGGSAR